MRIKHNFDDYLTEERNEFDFRKLSEDAPDDVKKEYDSYMAEIMDSINKNKPIAN